MYTIEKMFSNLLEQPPSNESYSTTCPSSLSHINAMLSLCNGHGIAMVIAMLYVEEGVYW